jgi:hypothetical protein
MNRKEALLFWAWVILSGMWVATVFVVMAEPHAHAPFAAVPVSWIVTVALGPPVLLLGVGLAGVWLTRGHRRRGVAGGRRGRPGTGRGTRRRD